VPVLILAGEHDRVESVEGAKSEVVPRYPGAKFVVIDAVDHLVPLEAPK